MKTFHCDKCGLQVFFENVRCERCGGMLGYQPEHRAISTFEAAGNDLWRSLNPVNAGRLYRQCANYAREHVCNWMIPAQAENDLCASCQLTHTIPMLTEQNRVYWQRLEASKRRLLYTLWDLKLQPMPKVDAPDTGLAFEFLQDLPTKRVMTGHANGIITLNIAEADPAHRERTREQMHEPYRTLLGHFRHESGHYYFDRLIADTSWITRFRELFGDERGDYGEALQRHYNEGPPLDWNSRYITTYASSHPWEDWAESWAHYLHVIDTIDTAFACGMTLNPKKAGEPRMVIEHRPVRIDSFAELMDNWFALSYVLNSLNRSVGMPDAYPFTLSTPVLEKLGFIHEVILQHRAQQPLDEHEAALESGPGLAD
ncbi:zinc-binding metallopeptidase family protein [Noviherbaspirillum pedocola]|uniref:Zinc-binding peptidase n=1 Tax=Noviherbaspirillum pedocola TaxID=2801341 RepID=A0A934SSC9_9BURK|nr:putative zinc-binding peptidase [Noviherbaspirillum pedocola]MBK4734585.1 putative zinc-binding peptidase [Noviherbaspirillum pedocola]